MNRVFICVLFPYHEADSVLAAFSDYNQSHRAVVAFFCDILRHLQICIQDSIISKDHI